MSIDLVDELAEPTETPRTFDWGSNHDPRSLEFPVRELITTPPRLRDKTWSRSPFVIDQGPDGACVGFGMTNEALCTPVRVDLSRVAAAPSNEPNAFAFNLYRLAQDLDGQDWTSGTSINAGFKAARQLGLIKEWRWAFSVEDVRDTVLVKGPVVLGLNWYTGMFKTTNGTIAVGGSLAGGHCVVDIGYRVKGSVFDDEAGHVILNSWGESWGNRGTAVIRESGLRRLLGERGEAAIPTKRSYGRAAR